MKQYTQILFWEAEMLELREGAKISWGRDPDFFGGKQSISFKTGGGSAGELHSWWEGNIVSLGLWGNKFFISYFVSGAGHWFEKNAVCVNIFIFYSYVAF